MTEGAAALGDLFDRLDPDLKSQVLTHSSWTERRVDSYERLAFLGDSVLGMVVADELAEQYPDSTAGDLTKIRAQAASRAACARVAAQLRIADRLVERAPSSSEMPVEELIAAQSVLAEVCEAVIGAVYLQHGFSACRAAVAEAFADEIVEARAHPIDFKSRLQEFLARHGARPEYVLTSSEGPAHDMTFKCAVEIRGDQYVLHEQYGTGSGRSKKEAEQAAAQAALLKLENSD